MVEAPRALQLQRQLPLEIATTVCAGEHVGIRHLPLLVECASQRLFETDDASSIAETRHQLGRRNVFLAQVVVCAGLQARDDIDAGVLRREQEYI